MRVIITGGSGHLGSLLAKAFHERHDEVVVVSRNPAPAPWHTIPWEALRYAVDGSDVVINLAGRSVHCRYGAANRKEIIDSRVLTTRAVGDAIAAAARPPRVWLQASTATIYAHRYDAANDEVSGIIGGAEPGAPAKWHFSIDVATAWERAADEAPAPATRKVKLRTAVVMSRGRDGAFHKYRWLVRHGLGGKHGDGRQWVSWIHERDFIRVVEWLIDHNDVDGTVNVAAPNPLTNADFLRAMREACGVRAGLPAKKWMLEIGSFLHRTESELLLKSRRVVPRRLLDAGFRFDFPTWPEAARDLCHDGRSEW